jgi:putative aldouronate transport system substrate-binding protein
MKTKLYAALSAVLAVVLLFGGCTKKPPEQHSNPQVVTDPGVYPILKEEYRDIKLSMMGLTHASVSPDWANNEYFKRMKELTGLDFSYEIYDWTTYGEKFPLSFLDPATMPDVFFKSFIPRASEVKYGSQGLLIPLEDLIDKYAPNLKRIMAETPNVEKVMRAADGHIYTLPTIHEKGDKYVSDGIFWINQKWLDNLGLEMPHTIEELSFVLNEFKTKDANGNGNPSDEKPMYLSGALELTYLYAAFGMNMLTWNSYVDDNGVVRFGPEQETFKTMLKYLNGMYNDNLLNRDYITLGKNQVWAEGRSGDRIGVFFDATANLVVGDRATDFVALPPLTSAAFPNPEKAFLSGRYAVDAGSFAISAHCRYPEAAMRWIDTLYDLEYTRWGTVGKEGVEWKWDDEAHTSWSYLMDTDTITSSRTIQMGGGLPGAMLSYDGFWSKISDPVQKQSIVELAKVSPFIKPNYPPVSFDERTLRAISVVSTDISEYVGTLMANVIRGAVDIDAQWSSVQDNLRRIGVRKYVDTLQAGYDAFMEN